MSPWWQLKEITESQELQETSKAHPVQRPCRAGSSVSVRQSGCGYTYQSIPKHWFVPDEVANKQADKNYPDLMFLLRQWELDKLSKGQAITGGTVLTVLAHGLYRVSDEDTSPSQWEINFLLHPSCQQCHLFSFMDHLCLPSSAWRLQDLAPPIPHHHLNPGGLRLCVLSSFLYSKGSKEQAGAHSYKPLITKLKSHFSGNAWPLSILYEFIDTSRNNNLKGYFMSAEYFMAALLSR